MIARATSRRHRRSSLTTTLRTALSDPNLLGQALDDASWQTWRALLIAAMGETLTSAERETFKQITGRDQEPKQRVEELIAVVGRRGGKSRAIAALAVFLATLCDYRHVLARGERGVLLVIAPDQRQASVVLNYAAAIIGNSRILQNEIIGHTSDSLTLRSGTTIEVRAASFRRLRGPTYIAVVADECAFWRSSEESANPDEEIINAVRPGLATTGGPLVIISSPYARRGLLWQTYKRHYGPQGDKLILVAQGATRTFNPSLPQRVIDRAYERDPTAASAEFGAEFRSDIEGFVSLDVVEACISDGIHERPPVSMVSYRAFVDPSGGSADSFTLAIGHCATDGAVLDALREVKPPFSPEGVVAEFATLLKTYNVSKVVGDRFAGEWPREQFRKHSITYEPSAKPKSDLYRDLLPLLNSHKIDLLDNRRLVQQLVGLERRTARSGRDSIDHAPNSHDDLANAAAGLASVCAAGGYDSTYSWVDDDDGSSREQQNYEWRRAMYWMSVLR